MRGNSHVRFGVGDEETCLGNGARRFIPTLPETPVRTLTLGALRGGQAVQKGRLGLKGRTRCASAHTTRHTDVRAREVPSSTNGTASRLTAATASQTAPGHCRCTTK
jgi:hypothetical protein